MSSSGLRVQGCQCATLPPQLLLLASETIRRSACAGVPVCYLDFSVAVVGVEDRPPFGDLGWHCATAWRSVPSAPIQILVPRRCGELMPTYFLLAWAGKRQEALASAGVQCAWVSGCGCEAD